MTPSRGWLERLREAWEGGLFVLKPPELDEGVWCRVGGDPTPETNRDDVGGGLNQSEKLEVVRDIFEDWVFDRATPGQVFDWLHQLLGVREQGDPDV